MRLSVKLNAPKKQKQYYSGKKKRHTLKAQLIVDAKTLNIICVNFGRGHVHDFRIFKECGAFIPNRIRILADSGYQRIEKIHKNSLIPMKSSKKHKLTSNEKAYNRSIAKQRIFIEHVNRYIKRFRIFSSRYRNRRHLFALRFSLVCGIFNRQH